MRKRLFIAINLSKEVKDHIEKILKRMPQIEGVKFVDRENWHITLWFLGYQSEGHESSIVEAMKAAVEGAECPEIAFSNIAYGPSEKVARMIWLNGTPEAAKKLEPFKNILGDRLIENGINFQQELRQFRIHITLSRLHSDVKKNLPPLDIKIDSSINFKPESIDLMESVLSRSGAEYTVLQKIYFD